ncbi:hypothetical protein V6N12_025419 [Hibiscus sabdariffa]|uniref:Protein FATTY ACID EXPORT 3, chloroplastic n=1 Tax=Hibiscus sabdariffa TaxID=183260 RepID=A0ABR2CID0_9ROSI
MFSIRNLNPSCTLDPLNALRLRLRLRRASASPLPPCFPPSLRLKPPYGTVSLAAPKGLLLRFCSLHSHRPISFSQSVVAFAASHEESKHSEVDVERENDEESCNEAWKQALEAFKEQALKMQSVSQEAYEIYSKLALIILKETSVQLKIQAEKAKYDLIEILKEIGEEGKVYLSTAAANSPPQLKEMVETFSSYSANDFNDVSKVLDFHVGIPYGIILSVGGCLSFMMTGSISAIRFGVILGGALLAVSVSSLRSNKRGESNPLASKGQAVISSVIFLRELSLLAQKTALDTFLATLLSKQNSSFSENLLSCAVVRW